MCSTNAGRKKQGRSRGRLEPGPWGHLFWGHPLCGYQPGLQCLPVHDAQSSFPSREGGFSSFCPDLTDGWGGGEMPCLGSFPRPAACVSHRSFQRWEKNTVTSSPAGSSWPSPAPFHCFGLVTSLRFGKRSVNGSPVRASGGGLLATAGKPQKNHLETHFLPLNSSYYDK